MSLSNNARPFYALAIIECMVMAACFAVSFWALDNQSPLDITLRTAISVASVCILIELMMLAVGLFTWHISTGYADLMVRVLAAFAIGYAAYAIMVYMIGYLRLPPDILLLALAMAFPSVLLLRLAFVRLTKLSQLKTRVLVLGTGGQAARIQKLEKEGRSNRFSTIGFVALEKLSPRVDQDQIVDMPDDLAAYAKSQDVDEIVVAMEERRGQLPLTALINSRLSGINVTEYQTFCERVQERIDLDALKPSWFFQSGGFRSSPFHRILKRIFDILLSLALLIFTMPLLIITAIAIRLESPGGAFYRQERVGLGGKPFILIKFRSMRDDAEKDGEAQWAQKSDPRVTRIGGWIRKSRIDEIPQVLNVLKGDMSFVGPRPERPMFVKMLTDDIPFYQERHSVRPGITGWAQLNYPYGASTEDARQKLQYDLFYIKYFSLVFDLSIVLQTLRVVIWSDGAR
ncbi:TIGR03013 family XrtA/PEP-CTERM system glycosyltransferase [Iodidimonas gelatinilytica]|nr:TIGR03013 family XrtA/PEP-CTERM system glycosyltransferase [Iodidimonas gelatinilytica]